MSCSCKMRGIRQYFIENLAWRSKESPSWSCSLDCMGLYSLRIKTFSHMISSCLEAAKLTVMMITSFAICRRCETSINFQEVQITVITIFRGVDISQDLAAKRFCHLTNHQVVYVPHHSTLPYPYPWNVKYVWLLPVLSGLNLDHRLDPLPKDVMKHTGPRFNIKMSSYKYRKSHRGDKTVVRSSYLNNGISYAGKMTSLYWSRALIFMYP